MEVRVVTGLYQLLESLCPIKSSEEWGGYMIEI